MSHSYLKLALPVRSHRGWLLTGKASFEGHSNLSKAIVRLVEKMFSIYLSNLSKAF